MTAPTPTARQTPTGRRIPEGFTIKVTFATQPALGIWEVKVKGKGADGGEPINISTQHNVKWESMAARTLRKQTDTAITAGIDPDAFPTLDNLINFNDTITLLYPDGSTECYYGYLQKYEATEWEIGGFPLVNLTIIPTNCDPSNFAEQGPVFTAASGT